MQNAALAALKLNWRYLAFEVHPDNLRAAIEGAKAMRFIGLNLTVPHKLPALEMVDAADARARLWGAVNTIVFETRDSRGGWSLWPGPGTMPSTKSAATVSTRMPTPLSNRSRKISSGRICAGPRC